MINLAGELKDSLVNGPGLRYVIFLQFCPHRCEGCQNKFTWSKTDNLLISVNSLFDRITEESDLIDGVTFSGGEPFMQSKELYELGLKLKNKNLNLMVYTGFTYEEIINSNNEDMLNLLSITDILMDGKFEYLNTKNHGKYRGSKNQRMLYLEKGKILREE